LHNKAVIVPDVKGLSIEEASVYLRDRGLRFNVIDSVFSKNAQPGAIVEVIPTIGSKVKAGRIVFITVNARNSQMAIIPSVKDLSYRQAYALLKARGFESIEIAYIHGNYKDLAESVELYGRTLEDGERVQLSAPLVLKVSNGLSQSLPPDTAEGEASNSEIESWF
jgi:beta-lactam-binding protein with PASTA domain